MNITSDNITHPDISIQYLIIVGYVIISWGTFNIVSILSKIMLIYLYIFIYI